MEFQFNFFNEDEIHNIIFNKILKKKIFLNKIPNCFFNTVYKSNYFS